MSRLNLSILSFFAIVILACQTTDIISSYLSPPPTEAPTRVPTRPVIALPTLPAVPPVAVVATPTPVEINGTLNSNANIRAAPSTSAAIAARVSKGDQLRLVGRNPANDWYLVRLPDNPSAFGWISAGLVQVEGAERLPVIQPGAPPPYPRP